MNLEYDCLRSGSFYGINLNQNVVLQQIGFDGKTGSPWNRLFKISTGSIIITALGFVPGILALLSFSSPLTMLQKDIMLRF
jgi:hypothetical protein